MENDASKWTPTDYERIFVIAALTGMFAFALAHELIWGDAQIKNILIGGLLSAFSGSALQWLFGTTVNSGKKDETINQQAKNTEAALRSIPPKPIIALVAFLTAGALLMVAQPARAADLSHRPPVKALNCGFPHPDPGCQGGATPDNPFSGVLQFSVEDLNTAIDFASKPPILQNEIACFSMIRDGMEAIKGFADTKGFGLATVYVVAVRVNALKQSIMTSGDCLAVCGRAESLVPVGLFTRIPINVVPTMCSVLKATG